MLDEVARHSLLYDFYGPLLTKRQQEVLRLYHEDNLSLSEIAEEFGISRQGVHDALKSAEHALTEYEAKLGLLNKMEQNGECLRRLAEILGQIRDLHPGDPALHGQLDKADQLIANLGE